MSFKRLLYLLENGPRIIRLIKELWKVLTQSTDEQVLEYLSSVEDITEKLKNAKSKEDRSEIAMRISGILSSLSKH